jgi:small subunit ribosomal protein S17
MDRTIVVKVQRIVKHPVYKKYVKRSSNILAHDEGNECAEGDTVTIQECRPLSRRKSWLLRRIVERARQV